MIQTLPNHHETQHHAARLLPGSGTRHQSVSLKIAAAILFHVESKKLGFVLQAPCNVILSRETIVQPDILFISSRRSGLIEEKILRGSPDLVVEIQSEDPHHGDLCTKRKIYSRFEVKEYWIADLRSDTIEVLLWSELGYVNAGIYHNSDRLSSPALPGFRLPLSRVFAHPR